MAWPKTSSYAYAVAVDRSHDGRLNDDLPVVVGVFGEVEVTRGNKVVGPLPKASAQTLALIAVSEPVGITSQQQVLVSVTVPAS